MTNKEKHQVLFNNLAVYIVRFFLGFITSALVSSITIKTIRNKNFFLSLFLVFITIIMFAITIYMFILIFNSIVNLKKIKHEIKKEAKK